MSFLTHFEKTADESTAKRLTVGALGAGAVVGGVLLHKHLKRKAGLEAGEKLFNLVVRSAKKNNALAEKAKTTMGSAASLRYNRSAAHHFARTNALGKKLVKHTLECPPEKIKGVLKNTPSNKKTKVVESWLFSRLNSRLSDRRRK